MNSEEITDEITDALQQEPELSEEINDFNLRDAVIYSVILEQKFEN
ncbi:MAG: hypothetical protein FWE63_00095 [Bacteroidales bacterium]|nr:hypothetical protein [Bacteroidales bacterium]